MKANEHDYKKYSNAIDQIQQGNEAMIDLFNTLEDDVPTIKFHQDLSGMIERAKAKYGNDIVDEKINTVVYEMISWLDLADVNSEEDSGK